MVDVVNHFWEIKGADRLTVLIFLASRKQAEGGEARLAPSRLN
jgi:hypothetical protein